MIRDGPDPPRSRALWAALTALLTAACSHTWLEAEVPLGGHFDEQCLEAAIRETPGTELVDEGAVVPLLPFGTPAFKIYTVRLSETLVGDDPALAYVYQSEGRGNPLSLRFETARMSGAAIDSVSTELTSMSVEIFEKIYDRCGSEGLESGEVRCSRLERSRERITVDCLSAS